MATCPRYSSNIRQLGCWTSVANNSSHRVKPAAIFMTAAAALKITSQNNQRKQQGAPTRCNTYSYRRSTHFRNTTRLPHNHYESMSTSTCVYEYMHADVRLNRGGTSDKKQKAQASKKTSRSRILLRARRHQNQQKPQKNRKKKKMRPTNDFTASRITRRKPSS